MNSDDMFWLGMWRTVAVVVMVLMGIMGSCVMQQNAAILSMVEQGEDPQKAACAYGTGNAANVCAILSTHRKQ